MGTGWYAANVKPDSTAVVVGDGAVGLLGVLSAKQVGAERIIAMSRHPTRQKLALEFGATDIVTERGDEGVARIKDLTNGIGAAPVRRFLPKLIDLVWNKKINPGKVFDLMLPLDQVAEGYRAMDERHAIKALLQP
jgi:threonine dehydrogenase-like Zn-dependent dehydrogenase